MSKQQLLTAYKQLSQQQQTTLVAFAEFLVYQHQQQRPSKVAIPEPKVIEKPANESVIKAIKRLSASYFMVDTDSLMNPVSDLMLQHTLKGRDKVEVITELEQLFEASYQTLKAQAGIK